MHEGGLACSFPEERTMRTHRIGGWGTALVATIAALTFATSGAASAEPAAPASGDLMAIAAADSPEAVAIAEDLLHFAGPSTGSFSPATNVPQPFPQAAPTFGGGCGGGFTPVAMTRAWVHPGPTAVPEVPVGEVKVYAAPTIPVLPAHSDLKFAWLNVDTNVGGLETLDDVIGDVPQLSKTVKSGTGRIVGTLYGSLSYVNGITCALTPTMGGFFA